MLLLAAEEVDGFGLFFDLGASDQGDLVQPSAMRWRMLPGGEASACALECFAPDGSIREETQPLPPHLHWDGAWTIEVR